MQDDPDNGFFGSGSRVSLENAKYPLPPEGQRADEEPDGSSNSDQYEAKLKEKNAKFWKEGWYVWYSKSRWAAQEKLDLMVYDLSLHSQWYKHMGREKSDWERARKGNEEIEPPSMRITAPRGLYRDPAKQSVLIQLPPPLPQFSEHIQNVLTPTHKLLTILHDSLESGAQRRLAGQVWEKAWSGEPLLLAQDVCVKMWDLWKKGRDY